MNNNKDFEQRLSTLETKLLEIIDVLSSSKQKAIDKNVFMEFYNSVKFSMPIKADCIPMCIWINDKYAENMQKTMLYPSDIEGYWYITGEISPMPIAFKDIGDKDYYIDFYASGNFKEKIYD